jgi:SAM-dependent methyltransferase
MSPAEFDATDPAHVALWDELPLWSALAGQLLLDHVPLDVTRVLDLGSATGFPALEISERLAPGALVIGVDPWGVALERSFTKARAWPAPRYAPVRADGARLPIRTASIDLVTSNLGVNNFADADAAFAECLRALESGGRLALSTNVIGHFRELYDAFDAVLARAGDEPARERLRAHVAHRATVAGLTATLVRHGFAVVSTHERDVPWRFGSGTAVFSHHFMRLGFVPAWREVAGERADEHLRNLERALDAIVGERGELSLTVALAVVIARAA